MKPWFHMNCSAVQVVNSRAMADFSIIGDLLELLGWIGKKTRLLFTSKVDRATVTDAQINDFFIGAVVVVALIALVVVTWIVFGT